MHTDGKQRPAAPYYNWSCDGQRLSITSLPLKLNAEILNGSDWQANDYDNKIQTGILSDVISGNRISDPNFNGINVYGDETSFNMDGFSYYVQDQIRRGILAATGNQIDLVKLSNIYYGAIGNPGLSDQYTNSTDFPLSRIPSSVQALQSPAIAAQTAAMFPFYNGYKNNYFKNASVSRTGYNEKDLVDYNAINVKLNAGLYWKITNTIEASWNSYFGTGTNVYTGADRYSLKNFKIAQHKLEVQSIRTGWCVAIQRRKIPVVLISPSSWCIL